MKIRLTILVVLCLLPFTVDAQGIGQGITFGQVVDSPQGRYAQKRLLDAAPPARSAIFPVRFDLSIDPRLGAEAYSISGFKNIVTIKGGDSRGLIYGALEAREQLRNWVPASKVRARSHTPSLAFRGIKLNTPWDSYRPSSAIDQHAATLHDLGFWEAYLDMMVENRFNAFTLWTMHPFTYMIRPKNFPEASKWTDAQFAEWQHLYHEIFRMAKERGLDTYVVFWSIFVSEEFEKAHNPNAKNFYPHYYVDGDTSDVTKRYLRESVTQMLVEYPDLDGIGVSHGEGMGGMTPLQRQQFVDEVYIAGALEAKKSRPVKLIHRVPFSSGLTSGPGVSGDVEKLTRTAMEKLGNQFDGPIWVEMKFNWSHGHSTPHLIKVHGGKLGDTYFKPTPPNYKVVWQVRNEDFFALRWGSPDFVRAHIKENGRQKYVGGYFVGSETYIPALDYFTNSTERVDWKWAFQRQWLFYSVWGRLLYDPKTPDSVFAKQFQQRYFNVDGAAMQRAYALASRIPLTAGQHLRLALGLHALRRRASSRCRAKTTQYIGVDALINQPTLDPAYVSVADFVKTTLAGGTYGADRITPLQLADLLERDCHEALNLVRRTDTKDNASLAYEVADIRAWGYLGLHLAEKLRGAVALATYRLKGGDALKQSAAGHFGAALAAWKVLAAEMKPLYREMKLTHYNGNSFDANPNNSFRWDRVQPEVEQDVATAIDAKGPAPRDEPGDSA